MITTQLATLTNCEKVMARTNVVKFPPSYKRLRKKRAKDAPYTGFKPVTRQSQKGQDAVEAIIFKWVGHRRKNHHSVEKISM